MTADVPVKRGFGKLRPYFHGLFEIVLGKDLRLTLKLLEVPPIADCEFYPVVLIVSDHHFQVVASQKTVPEVSPLVAEPTPMPDDRLHWLDRVDARRGRHLPAHRRRRPLQPFGYLPDRQTAGNST
jgi:hypothetical protein